MTTLIAGSLANDHLMTFSGKFSEAILPDQIAHISVSFLVDSLEVRRGGVGGNIAFALGVLGQKPVLVAGAGVDFPDYGKWLSDHGVDISHVQRSSSLHTARFVCTTDTDLAQISSFYPGAMALSAEADIAAIVAQRDDIDLVLIGADDPQGMLKHTAACKDLGLKFAADPSQQLTFLDGDSIKELIDGAHILFSNEYELGLIESKTGWSVAEIDSRIDIRVTTRGANGAIVRSLDNPEIAVEAVTLHNVQDPTGGGDSFRGGFLTAYAQGFSAVDCVRLGSVIAGFVLETVGTQEWTLDKECAASRLTDTYGAAETEALIEAFLK